MDAGKPFNAAVLHHEKWRRLCVILALAPLLGMNCPGGVGQQSGTIIILATPTGCGVKIDNQKTISWSITFTAVGGANAATVNWTFPDGSTATGRVVVHTFKTALQEAGDVGDVFDTGEHQPIQIDVNVSVGSESGQLRIEVPMRGTPDGGPEPGGDTCVADEGRTHVLTTTQICYASNPPASGAHYSIGGAEPAPVQPGFYDEALVPERWVHNLEHGTVVLLYDCGGPCTDELKAQLQAFFDSLPPSPRFNEKKMVITRYSGVNPNCPGFSTFPASGPFLAISWGVQHAFSDFDTAGILDFYIRHVDQGPEDEPIPVEGGS